MRRIVCYGDSNTWGFVPGTGARYDENTRWTALLQKQLGADYQVVEEGVNARLTGFDDPYRDYLNGVKGLSYSLMASKPIDLLIISLGTNDLKVTNVVESQKGLKVLLNKAVNAAAHMDVLTPGDQVFSGETKILVISPIHLGVAIDTDFPDSAFCGKYRDSLRFAELYKPVCDLFGVEFMDAAEVAGPSSVDCVHMEPESHKALADAVAIKVKEMMEKE